MKTCSVLTCLMLLGALFNYSKARPYDVSYSQCMADSNRTYGDCIGNIVSIAGASEKKEACEAEKVERERVSCNREY